MELQFRHRATLAAVAAALILAPAGAMAADSDAALERRRQYLEILQKILPHTTSTQLTGRISAFDKDWEDAIKRTGELPPDFDSMPSTPGLPDPLVLHLDSGPVPIKTPEQWRQQRQWIRSQMERWIYGKMPPAPDNLRAVVTGTHKEGTVTVRDVRLEFGPDHRATLRLRLFIPEGKGPFPVFLTNQRAWVYTPIRRGYLTCYYSATDPNYGDQDDSDKFIEVYPQYDFACLARWAWAGMRAVDYLYTLPEVDKRRIGITGHSRNGKQALLAAAFDERIGAVVASSGTTGECLPWRYTTDTFAVGSIEGITSGPHNTHWFVPRLRFFAGREDRLPVDQNMLLAMVAPRGLMMYAGYAEHEGNPFGYEQAYRSAQRVFRFLGHEEKLCMHLRPGEHATTAADIENFVNFFDTVFGRKEYPRLDTWVNGYTFERWLQASGEKIDPLRYPERKVGDFVPSTAAAWDEARQAIRKNILWALGEEASGLPGQGAKRLPSPSPPGDNLLGLLFGRPLKRPGMGATVLPFGDGLRADLYFPAETDGRPTPGPWPVVVWLHSYSYATGYSRYAAAPFESLTKRGYAVLAFDQLGYGDRVLDARYFCEQYPRWSLMGKMVTDTRAAIDAVSELDVIDPRRIYIFGNDLGAKVGLITAALDPRVKALAVVNGFDPLRLDAPEKGTEGVGHYSHLHGLLPRLGFFIGKESRLPFDFDQALASIAPRPVLVVAPTLSRYARMEDVRREVEASRAVYRLLGAETALELQTPLDFARLPRQRQEQIFDWLQRLH
jgi:dienelactone hydrolase